MSAGLFVLALVSLLIVLNARSLGKLLRVMDLPGGHKKHDAPTPLVGGFAVILPFVVFCAAYYWQHPHMFVFGVLILAVGGAFLLGFFDDRHDISPICRLLVKTIWILACLLLLPQFVVEQLDFTFTARPVGLAYLSIPFSAFVLLGLTNAINMVDGMNGLACGLCLIWSAFFLYYAPPEFFEPLLLLMLCLLVTLLSNLMGRLFLGDSGTYGLGILIGLLSIFIYNTTSGRLPADVVTIWFSVPVIDCLRLMADRAICKQRSPFSPDQNHLHHRMQLLLPKWLALVTYWMLVAVPGSLAIAEPKLAPLLFVFVFSLYLGIVVLSSQYWIARFTYFRDLLSRTLARRQARAFPGQGRSQARKLAPRSFPPPRPLSPRSEVKRNQTTSR